MAKEKKKDRRIREFSAGGLVFKKDISSNNVLWLVTKSSPSQLYKSSWRLPKGWIDDDVNTNEPGEIASGKKRSSEEDLEQAALREVEEEAGVVARIIQKIGTEKYFYVRDGKTVLKFVTFFLMEWVEDKKDGPGLETEEVRWLPIDEAIKTLSFKVEKEVLKKANNKLFSKDG